MVIKHPKMNFDCSLIVIYLLIESKSLTVNKN